MHSLKLKSPLIKLTKKQRLYELDIPIIGLTGGIASGKSTVSKLFREQGLPVIDADALIHKIYQSKETIELITQLAPSVVEKQNIDFTQLRELFFSDPLLKQKITHHLYQQLPHFFKKELSLFTQAQVIVYDVPLLFENTLETKLDCTITVYAPRNIQLDRLKKRDKISDELANKILDQQMDIEEKKKRSDYLIENTKGLKELNSNFQILISNLFI